MDSSTPAKNGKKGSNNGRRDSTNKQKKRPASDNYCKGGTWDDPLNLKNPSDDTDMVKENDDDVTKPLEIPIWNARDPNNFGTPEKKKKKLSMDGKQIHSGRRSRSNSPSLKKKNAESDAKDSPKKTMSAEQEKKLNKKEYFNNKYRYGNFDRYYGTRLGPAQKDQRLELLQKEWFERRSVLDIGCNVGFLTLSLAKEFSPRRILGIDIDEHLVGAARKNIRHYCDKDTEFSGNFPASFSSQFGPIANTPLAFSTKFPDNVWFRKENYVLTEDQQLENVEEEFDVILALSITKWIQLNFGDDGLRRFFRRAFKQLLPGGRFIVEAQTFDSYKKRAKMTEEHKRNFEKIRFKPDEYEKFLIEDVGFEKVEHLGVANVSAKGFQRPMDVYRKQPPKFMK